MKLAEIFERAWSDTDYKNKLLRDPEATLAEAGVDIPAGVAVKVVENTAGIRHVVLPEAPVRAGRLSMEELEQIAGGYSSQTQPLIMADDALPENLTSLK